MNKFTFSIPNKKEYVMTARLMATSIAGVNGFDIEAIEDIRLAVGEACNNAVLHGVESDFLNMEVVAEDDCIKITVKDQGKGFTPKPVKAMDIDDYDGSGLGLFIIESLMDEMCVDSNNDCGTMITMVKHK